MKRLVFLILLLSVPAVFAQPAQIILIRHAEKPDDKDDPHLTAKGREHARALVNYVTHTPELLTNGTPAALFATHATAHDRSLRPHETLEPLAKELKLKIQTPVLAKDYAALAKQILGNRKFQGRTVLICWTHTEITQLAAALGVKPEPKEWKAGDFDRVLLISYHDGKAGLSELNQKLSADSTLDKKSAADLRQPR